jgi:hypothetical protein
MSFTLPELIAILPHLNRKSFEDGRVTNTS